MNSSWRTDAVRILNRPVLGFLLVMALSGVLLLPGRASAQEKLAGEWRAQQKTPSGDQSIVLVLDLSVPGTWSGSVTDLETSEGEIELTALKVSGNTVSFNFQGRSLPYPGSFWGNYDEKTDRISGTFSFGGRSLPMTRFERHGGPVIAVTDEEAEPERPRKHQHRLALSARAAYWKPVHVIEDDHRNINDVTSGNLSYDLSLRWYAMDALAFWGRYYVGGLSFDSQSSWINQFDYLGLNTDSFLEMNGWEAGLNAYFGQAMIPNSRFNPYVTFSAGQVYWKVLEHTGHADLIAIDDVPLESTSTQVGFGLGSEYAFTSRWALEFEWAWKYAMTEDKTKWPNSDEEWTNTNYWTLAIGAIFAF